MPAFIVFRAYKLYWSIYPLPELLMTIKVPEEITGPGWEWSSWGCIHGIDHMGAWFWSWLWGSIYWGKSIPKGWLWWRFQLLHSFCSCLKCLSLGLPVVYGLDWSYIILDLCSISLLNCYTTIFLNRLNFFISCHMCLILLFNKMTGKNIPICCRDNLDSHVLYCSLKLREAK